MGKIAGSLVDFGTAALPSDSGTGSQGIAGFPLKFDLNRLVSTCSDIDEGHEFTVVHPDDKVRTTVAIEIGLGETPTITRNKEAALVGWDGLELARPIAKEENAQAATEGWGFELGRSKVLHRIEVEVSIAIDITEAESEDGGRLRFIGKILESKLA